MKFTRWLAYLTQASPVVTLLNIQVVQHLLHSLQNKDRLRLRQNLFDHILHDFAYNRLLSLSREPPTNVIYLVRIVCACNNKIYDCKKYSLYHWNLNVYINISSYIIISWYVASIEIFIYYKYSNCQWSI